MGLRVGRCLYCGSFWGPRALSSDPFLIHLRWVATGEQAWGLGDMGKGGQLVTQATVVIPL